MTVEARVLACQVCGAPTSFLAASCGYCRSPLTWHDVPTLRRGRPIRAFDLRRGELMPGMREIAGMEVVLGRGVILPIDAMRQVFLVSGVQRADVAVRLEATALDAGVGFGIELRVTRLGEARTSYAVKLLPWLRAFRLMRLLSTDQQVFTETLRAPESLPQLGGPNESVDLEVRCADSILSIHASQIHLGSFVDARYGFGGSGISVSGYHAAGRVLLESFALYEVT